MYASATAIPCHVPVPIVPTEVRDERVATAELTNVPDVGRVTLVAPVVVSVRASAPDNVKLPEAGVNPVTVSALPVNAPVNPVEVIEVAPVITPASTTTAPSNTICWSANGVINKSVPAVELIVLPFMFKLSI